MNYESGWKSRSKNVIRNSFLLKINRLAFALLLGLLGAGSSDQTARQGASMDQSPAALVFKLKTVTNHFTSPVVFTHANDGLGRQFLVGQPGRILLRREGKPREKPFLDLSAEVIPLNNAYSEMGLLRLAFHPDYRHNGRFFLYYTDKNPGQATEFRTVLAEHRVSATDPDVANPAGKIRMEFEDPDNTLAGQEGV